MNVLAIQPWYPSNAARFFVDAFEHLGHKVFRIGPTYFDHYGLQYPPEELSLVDHEIPRTMTWNLDAALNIAAKAGFIADLLWVSEENYQNLIMPTFKLPVVLWSADGWPNCYERLNMIQPTLAYTNHPLGVNPHPRTTIPNGWRFLPGAADSVWDVPDQKLNRPYSDFCLMATMYGPREKICQNLLSGGLMVNFGQCGLRAWRLAYSNALATYHNCNGQAEAKWRIFSSMALGCINICDPNYLLDAMRFEAWDTYVPVGVFTEDFDGDLWPSTEGIRKAISWLKEHNKVATHIARSAQGRMRRFDMYENRIAIVLRDLDFGEPERDEYDYDYELRQYIFNHPYTHRNLKVSP